VEVNSGVANRERSFDANSDAKNRDFSFIKPSVYYTFSFLMDFLAKHGTIDDELHEYTRAVLFGWINDYTERIIMETIDTEKFSEHVYDLVFNPQFLEVMKYKDSGKYDNLRDYTKRREFCEKLKYMTMCQSELLNANCTDFATHRLVQAVAKLDAIIGVIAELEQKENVNV
jgi:hypothetical protein